MCRAARSSLTRLNSPTGRVLENRDISIHSTSLVSFLVTSDISSSGFVSAAVCLRSGVKLMSHMLSWTGGGGCYPTSALFPLNPLTPMCCSQLLQTDPQIPLESSRGALLPVSRNTLKNGGRIGNGRPLRPTRLHRGRLSFGGS
ncbi:hypothetical protein EYF80_038512 [Liparis tanakae]|uniref:Uncharacterized protein n=1 Tax=Liparis tanakae TaxID=230148 RepID=A0A4Z2GF03_9TELE|nr:hypothetical protein EYF80_038512 [Liparis tanakae]